MELDPDTCYKAVASHDRRFDGRFFVGVSSTGIYCRPVCAVRTPKRENCTFYESAAAAEKHGFRPCLRCRPELAPGHGLADISGRLAQAAATLIDEGFMADAGVAALAGRIGVTERHLHRLFTAQFGVSVLEYVQTQRLLLAKRLLTDTALPVTEVALAAGFGSVRRFNDVLRTRYGLTPMALRKRASDGVADRLVFELGYRPPLAWEALLGFLAVRAVNGIEQVRDGAYARTLSVESGGTMHRGWVRLDHVPGRLVLRVTLSASLARVIPQALGKVRRLCDLGCRPDIVDRHLGELASDVPGMRLPGSVDGFEIAVRAVIGQVISVVQARRILARLAQAAGDGLPAPAMPIDGCAPLQHCFPSAAALAALPDVDMAAAGVSPGKLRTLRALAQRVASGELPLEPHMPPEQTVAALCEIDGIGDWTAQYVAMRALGWPDAFPGTDYALRKVLGVNTVRAMQARTAQWAPWRAYAAIHLWHRYEAMKTQGDAAVIPFPDMTTANSDIEVTT
ncbi:DNA-3-methyladenine glycosylase 2 family protein [Cupriavidus numazuensis]|uniref:DNA-3-methyladenine glycosylase II n=1 Tax=Cupriavidus numazuensis TaxID=221992 RepID=A0ABM8TPA0_9BURK|nr:DNA-3-methyladenine glycosylase 2 family protein [Cupriavidus numazuensis]CAG2157003.1 putative bifunctional transcriptional activator/DNA repair enzyme AlkA [Cupriavidus numazuensis]